MKSIFLLFPLVFFISSCLQVETEISVDANQEINRMAGGIGASWHAISADSIDESPEYQWALRYANSRGSAWGGNPPLTYTQSWKQMYDHASWLGFSFLRVELSARMYESERTEFDWNNEEMLALYKILDWAETNDADVFLQQMWSNVKWNSWPGVQPLLSAPHSVEDFAEGLATLADHLLNTRKYTCIKWLCITNEPPGGTWGSWWSKGEKNAQLTPALKAVREALDRREISLPLSGPDWTDLPPFDADKIDFDSYIGAYDIHSYHGINEEKQKILKAWVAWAKEHKKPLFLSELGDMRLGWKDSNPGPKSFNAALSNAESILRGMQAGVGAFNRWSFTNRGDLDGQWQLIRTFDINTKQYLDNVKIEPQAYYGYGIFTRFLDKYSSLVFTSVVKNDSLLTQTVKNSTGELTTWLLNKGTSELFVGLSISGAKKKDFYLYNVTEEKVSKPNYRMDPENDLIIDEGKEIRLTLPGKSISALTNKKLMHEDMATN